ncbi:uncharacterized protein A1O9_04164 [Exophiala aquamarina CBS 119918]|uniref:Uncharacterized protein n=1 Tax=Exophiala aquamarina CBS 119918 TaxID=1182545 RepID=A0A072PUX7_9EURO|nr:uncharacterized protein A1O9_04164 [Exophiala aquamarina CBS 119918]KEF59320.1 hypothetical protein A1O9_04164 [Exophiala aquamarina CBS 119918]
MPPKGETWSAIPLLKQNRSVLTTENAQRYTDLLLQHHAALTAGLIELYSRSLEGHKWAGPPVEEINGTPSVHRILEELGVIEGEDEVGETTDTKPGSFPYPACREPVAPLRLRTTNNNNHSNLTPGPKIKKLLPILQLQVPPEGKDKKPKTAPPQQTRSPLSTASTASTYANIASTKNSYSPMRRGTTQCIASPPGSGGLLSSRRSSGGGASTSNTSTFTPGPWDSPEFGDELFTTPVPSPTCSSPPQQDYPYEQQQQQQQQQQRVEAIYGKQQPGTAAVPGGLRATSAAAAVDFDFPSSEMYMREPLVPSSLGSLGGIGFPSTATAANTATIDAETCSASGYFYDATTCGMGSGSGSGSGAYGGGWDYSTANSNSLGYQDFGGMEYSSWDSGVFV